MNSNNANCLWLKQPRAYVLVPRIHINACLVRKWCESECHIFKKNCNVHKVKMYIGRCGSFICFAFPEKGKVVEWQVECDKWTSRYMITWNGIHFPHCWPLWGEFAGHRWIPLTKANHAELWCILGLNKWLSKQSRRRWFETASHSFWRTVMIYILYGC